MGGGSGSKSKSSSDTTYKNTTTSNPYVESTTNNGGTTTNFKSGTSLDTIYKFTNENIGSLLNELLNPSIDSATNQAKLNYYADTLRGETNKALENNIISPLAQRNMLRSSQATNLYRDLANQQEKSIADYTNQLITDTQNNAGDVLNNLMNLVFQGYNVLQGNQAQSLQTSAGNASKQTSGNSNGYSYGL